MNRKLLVSATGNCNTVVTLYSRLYNRLYNWLYEHSRLYNYANEPSQAALDVIRLTRSKAAAWTTAEVDDVARMVEFLK